ncbi:BREX-1 system adenine-specific DNA-methyltransferase PglX [Humibacter ginsenosidimutans]|uniref:site-specific DNA-methyltransferase (adenine-specific) n=1 Tax=Humibacter ginsenosidimutans TaxID=2599293 RepID=A0A5B8MA17_9MICO|nr:BREX-1 system adenine-specific DNA-methyltransferase PglX [Humibacter ginsenosidimutans]QDZ16290.1 BREX-1 system adenine-specific DNA-methyltransferase PglX [Humibacter ginsenosidimutans]
MGTAPLKSFATWARTELIKQVGARIATVLAPSSSERVENTAAIKSLETAVKAAGGEAAGRAKVADKVAYTWFNRIIALRFMDANGYTGVGIVSPHRGQVSGQPEVLADAKRGVIDTDIVGMRTAGTITALLDGTRRSADPQGEAYSLLLADYCHHWHRSMPFMFEREGDYTELLIPANLLADDSVRARAVAVLTEEVCHDVEVIGWLYQFYISERKDEVFAGFKKNKKAGADEIPAATQLFTPHWIVRYLVENSLGRLWVLNHPDSHLVNQMEYYIAPVDEETDFLRIGKAEELTVIDPACGSGHMLTYAFDLLYAIYEEQGEAPSDIPGKILTHNLYGTEIDRRAGSLAAFALTMKARARQRTFFNKHIQPNICVIEPISFSADELDFLVTKDGDKHAEEAFWNQFAEADTFGSLIRPNRSLTSRLADHLATLEDHDDILRADALDWAQYVIEQAEYLARRYAVVVANPPYMGSKQMNARLSQFMKDEYATGKADLMTAFMIRGQELTVLGGSWAMIGLPSWMSLKSFEQLRRDLLQTQRIASMVHLGRGVFGSDFGSVAFVIGNVVPSPTTTGVYRRLFEQHVEVRAVTTIENLFRDVDYHRFEVAQADFAAIPGTPIVYWLSEKTRGSFAAGKPLSEVANLRQGLATADNGRFLRQWWEVAATRTAFSCTSREEAAASGARWFPYNKGGEFRKWYGNQEHVVNWEHDGAEIVAFKPRSVIRNPGTYFSPSVSWSDISSGEAAFRRYPQGFIHDSTGHSGFGDPRLLDQITLLLNSRYVMEIMKVVAPTLHFHIGYVGLVPVAEGIRALSTDAMGRLIETAQDDWDSAETSWGFERNPLITLRSSTGGNLD